MYHFHLYYEIEQIESAKKVLSQFADEFDYDVGRVWDRPVGPHPIGSCQVTVPEGAFEDVSRWFLINRNGFDLFVHIVTGDDWLDHTEGVMWIGKSYSLNLDFFKNRKK